MGQAAENIKKPEIHTYHDYVDFLRDWTNYLKADNAKFSLRQMARDCGLAVGYLPMCLSRKRRLSHKALYKILPRLGLSRGERRYLELLWIVAESEDPKSRIEALNKIQRFERYRLYNSHEIEVYRYLTKWFYPAIREMVALKDFRPEAEWIQKRLNQKPPLEEVKAAVEFMLAAGFLERDNKGALKIPQRLLECKEGVYKISLGEFHRQMLSLASDSIETVSRDQRIILGHTFSIPMEAFEQVRQVLSECLEKIEQIGLKVKSPEEVYQVQLAAFPLTRVEGDGGKS